MALLPDRHNIIWNSARNNTRAVSFNFQTESIRCVDTWNGTATAYVAGHGIDSIRAGRSTSLVDALLRWWWWQRLSCPTYGTLLTASYICTPTTDTVILGRWPSTYFCGRSAPTPPESYWLSDWMWPHSERERERETMTPEYCNLTASESAKGRGRVAPVGF